jgi:hypothetical protein
MSDDMKSRILNTDMNRRSSFEASLVSQNSGAGERMQGQGYASSGYQGKTGAYSAVKAFDTKGFEGKQKNTSMAGKNYHAVQSTMGEGRYSTTAADLGNTQSRYGNNAFNTSQSRFQNQSVRDAARSRAENVRPTILPRETGPQERTAYSEAEVRSMVNRK